MTILVTGATGTVGSALVGLLASKEQKVRAGVHSKERAQAFSPLGVPIVELDFARPQTFKPALIGVDTLFLIMPLDKNMARNTAEIAKEIKNSKVRRIVKLSALGDEGTVLIDAHRQSERAIERIGIPWTMLRPGPFMQNFLKYMGEQIRNQGKIFAPVGDGKIAFIDARDVADAAAAVLTTPGHDSKVYELTGSEAQTYYQAADIIGETIGRNIEYVPVTEAQARDAMAGADAWLADATLGLFAEMRKGKYEKMNDALKQLTGHEPRSLSEFAADHAQEFLFGPRFVGEPIGEKAEGKG